MKEEDKLTKQIKDKSNREIENDLDYLEKLEEELSEIENDIQKVEENFNKIKKNRNFLLNIKLNLMILQMLYQKSQVFQFLK